MNLLPFSGNQILLAVGWGQSAFIAVFLLVLVGLWLLPRSLLDSEEATRVWWKNVRFWATVVCSVQILIYWVWG